MLDKCLSLYLEPQEKASFQRCSISVLPTESFFDNMQSS